MALVRTFLQGDGQIQVQNKAMQLRAQMITDGALTFADYPVLDSSLSRFRRDCNAMFDQFVVDVAGFSTYTALGEGDSWLKCRTVLQANFTALDAIVNP